jgi:hypothetical protein
MPQPSPEAKQASAKVLAAVGPCLSSLKRRKRNAIGVAEAILDCYALLDLYYDARENGDDALQSAVEYTTAGILKNLIDPRKRLESVTALSLLMSREKKSEYLDGVLAGAILRVFRELGIIGTG